MIHGLKVTMAKGTAKREILESDESHTVTQSTMHQWKTALKSLHDALAANEGSWKALMSSFTGFHNAAAAVFAERDVEARSVLTALEAGRATAETPSATPPAYTALQQVELARQEIAAMLSRIQNAEALHAKRLEATRQYTYYDRKTKQMLANESKRNAPVPQKDLDRRARNQKKVMDLAIQLNSITTQLYTELEYIDMERLAVADRAVAAMLSLQQYYFACNPSKDACELADKIRVGRRVIPRDEVRPWMPNTLQPASVNTQGSNPALTHGTPPMSGSPATSMPQPPLQQQLSQPQPYPQQQMSNGVPQMYIEHQQPAQQPELHHLPSAPPAGGPSYSQPMYAQSQPMATGTPTEQYAYAIPDPPTEMAPQAQGQLQASRRAAVTTTQ